jgi:ATP-dependent RNA helicase SUPV3L1/SUV3
VHAIEAHRFEPLPSLFWRNPELDFRSVGALAASLDLPAPRTELKRMRHADDQRVLTALRGDADVMSEARTPERVRLLWEVCQIPDFRNVMSEAHARLLAQIFLHLASPARRLSEDWVAAQVAAIDRIEGDIDALLGRIASIRTWTYVSHRSGWLAEPRHWQERTRKIEDRLSDALHERLTEQFVDRRGAIIARADPDGLVAEIADDGEVRIQGLVAGRLEGFRFAPEPGLKEKARGLLAAANRVLRESIVERVRLFAAEADDAFRLGDERSLLWREARVARIAKGEDALHPRVDVLASELLDPPLRETVRRRLAAWLEGHLRARLGPLFTLREAQLGGQARGLAFTLGESLGTVPRRAVAPLIDSLTPSDRRALAGLGVRLGRWIVFLPATLEAGALRLRAVLWCLANEENGLPLPAGQVTAPRDPRVPASYYAACGYHAVGARVLRVDSLERALQMIHERARRGAFSLTPELVSRAGIDLEALAALAETAGFVRGADGRYARRVRSKGPVARRDASRQ